MRRDHIASVRLTADERERLNDLGGLAALVRRALRPASIPPAVPTTTAATRCTVTWVDGTFGAQWPQSVTA